MKRERCLFKMRYAVVQGALVAGLVLGAASARAQTDFLTVRLETVTNQFHAYAQVTPFTLVPVRVGEAGQINGFEIVPGIPVHAGQKLAELKGPEIEALLTKDETALMSAETNLVAAQKSLDIERQQLVSHLVTAQMLLRAEAAVAQARAARDAARVQLQSARQLTELTSPVDGSVLSINVAGGERVSAGQTICTLQPTNGLWLKAEYYGADAAAVRTGMTGRFLPAGGGEPVPVKVITVFGPLAPDGGREIGMAAATSPADWLNGEFGTVTLNGAQRRLPAVPTQALILDHGQWWVLLHTEKGEQRQAVTPGPSRGWQTFIESGLEPGQHVVVENAYLEFHKEISKTYRPPD